MATRGKNNKNNKNYNDIIEEEKKKNNFVDVVVSPAPTPATNNLVEELNNFSDKLMLFGKFKNKSFQALYFNNSDPKYLKIIYGIMKLEFYIDIQKIKKI